MVKRYSLFLISLVFLFGITSCSSGEKAKQVCDALVNKIYAACDQQDDAALIADYLDNYFTDVDEEYIANGSPDQFKSDCEEDFGSDLDDVPEELINDGVSEINNVSEDDCEDALQELSVIAATFEAYAAADWSDYEDWEDWQNWI